MMEVILVRQYYPDGTNGRFIVKDSRICFSIELPNLNNERQVSCIPEGKYELEKRHSQRFGWHLYVKDVPNRSFILIHPANCADSELRGCIAPVSKHTGIGKGIFSRKATKALTDVVFEEMENGGNVFLNIVNEDDYGNDR